MKQKIIKILIIAFIISIMLLPACKLDDPAPYIVFTIYNQTLDTDYEITKISWYDSYGLVGTSGTISIYDAYSKIIEAYDDAWAGDANYDIVVLVYDHFTATEYAIEWTSYYLDSVTIYYDVHIKIPLTSSYINYTSDTPNSVTP